MIKRFFSVLFAILLLVSLTLTVNAFEEPDMNRTGSVNITLSYQGTPVTGGDMTIYRVAEVYLENDADYSYRYVAEYAGCTASLENLNTADLAEIISDYTVENSISGSKKTIDNQGKVSFEQLELGLYLMVQETAGEGYETIAPFLVSVPLKENGSLVYDVDASPKLELVEKPSQPTEPTKPTNPTESTKPTKPTEPTESTQPTESIQPTEATQPAPQKLPQTGQLNWPIPVLVVSGLVFLILGIFICSSERKKKNEN